MPDMFFNTNYQNLLFNSVEFNEQKNRELDILVEVKYNHFFISLLYITI